MSQEILTGNLLSDGISYHASDINAAINNATLQPGAILNRSLQSASASDKIVSVQAGGGGGLISSTLQSVITLALTNIVTVGPANIAQGVQFSNLLAIATSGTLNDYNPTGFDKCTILALNGTMTVTGLQAGPTGTFKVIYNYGAGVVTVARENAGSQALNRFTYKSGAADVALQPGQCLGCMYTSGANARWLVLFTNTNLT